MKSIRTVLLCLIAILVVFSGADVQAQESADLPPPHEDVGEAFKPVNNFSPYAGRNFPTNVYWGDTHLHTGMSMDAGAFGARLLPEDAYRFARGEELTTSTGLQAKLSRPLDFLVVADHSDNMGFFPRLVAGDPKFMADPTGKDWYERIQKGGQDAVSVAVEVVQGLTQGTFPEALASLPGSDSYRSSWETTYKAAEKYNDPGHFTAFIGYEWTSTTLGFNLHRVVIMRDDANKASMVVPYTTVRPLGSDNPVDLWKWMANYQEKTGGRVLAIAHNGNLSNGIMFPVIDSFTGEAIDQEYASERYKWEPLYEATQIKGDGETHPFLSPNDEFADYETWDQGNLDLSDLKTDDMLQYEYARSALQIGLQLEQKLGINPYKFGMIGSTDSHTGLATAGEDNFFGKHSGTEPGPDRYKHPMAKMGDAIYQSYDMVASGLAAVWATDNTREALFDAMMRKETYATTGPRMLVRFFGGWNFTAEDATHRLPADHGYKKGVAMGSDLPPAPEGVEAPSFLMAALKDPISGNLDRIQVVKGWVDSSGERQEKVYNVVWSDPERRNIDADGNLSPVGNTVNVQLATWNNSIGSPELIGVWTDPDFDPTQPAVYYARVLEIPTPRWTAYEQVRFNITMPDEVEMMTQERAYTSPIWYTP
ncbi:DUF3604 domain-containing protein [Bacteroidota bacterium]